ncbi:MAG: DUF3408 domain-containing protein [Odoribacter sp.]|nr:DUF3408 domain-containing protein [Odoribacter sp.]
MAKKTNIEGIDENFIINSFRQDDLSIPPDARSAAPAVKPEGQVTSTDKNTIVEKPPVVKEESRRRKNSKQDYETLFIRDAPITARLGKLVYVCQEYHDRILKIIQVIGKNEISIASYINNVLEHHFATYQAEITELYNEHNRSIF